MTRALTETRRDDGQWIVDGRAAAAAGWTGEIRHKKQALIREGEYKWSVSTHKGDCCASQGGWLVRQKTLL